MLYNRYFIRNRQYQHASISMIFRREAKLKQQKERQKNRIKGTSVLHIMKQGCPHFFARKKESFLNYDFLKRQAIIIIEVTKGGNEGE